MDDRSSIETEVEGTVMSDVTGWVVAQLDSAAVLGSGGASIPP